VTDRSKYSPSPGSIKFTSIHKLLTRIIPESRMILVYYVLYVSSVNYLFRTHQSSFKVSLFSTDVYRPTGANWFPGRSRSSATSGLFCRLCPILGLHRLQHQPSPLERTLTLPALHRLCDDRHLNYVNYSEPSLLYQDSPTKQLSRLRGILPPGRGEKLNHQLI